MPHWNALKQMLVGALQRKGDKALPLRVSRARPVWSFEALEPRIALSAAGLTPVGAQPAGALSGKIVYMSAGHGWQVLNGVWTTDRPNLHSLIEPFGAQDQLTYYADYLVRAGATVVPMRPIGRQLNEVVLDNDSAGVTYTGDWTNSTTGGRWYDEDYGAVVDTVRYRFASASAEESATATYTPNIPQAGFYPVYVWASQGANRTAQLYRVNHTGGATEVRVDHRLVGNGWVYLGTYHFESGSSPSAGSVQISNESGVANSVVIADAVRFGNGLGDLAWSSSGIGTGTVSGQPREDESSILWVYRGLGQGVTASSVLGTSNVNAPLRMAAHMNASPYGTSLYVGFHSNASSNGMARGAVGLVHSVNPTPNQTALATYMARQIDLDMRARNGQFEHNWQTRSYTLSNSYGEITNVYAGGEFDATIIEVAFHDNVQDAALLRDPKVRDQIGRSVYEATVEYFAAVAGVPNVTAPSAPINVHADSNGSGAATISWLAGPSSVGGYAGVYGSPATGYRVYASVDGYGFDGGTYVSGGATTSLTLSGLDPDIPYYFKVVAENSGGQSGASEVVTALPSGGAKQVLVVNGFDRLDRFGNLQYTSLPPRSTGVSDRVWSRYNNSFDYVVQVHSAIHTAAPGVHVDSASNEAVISGAVDLTNYDAVVWILGEESTANETFSSAEQILVEQFLAGGGNLFLSGAEIGWDLDRPSGPTAADRAFYNTTLLAGYVADNAGTYSATPASGGIFAGLGMISFSNGATFSSLDGQVYNVDYPDVMTPLAGAEVALNYSGGAGAAAIQAVGSGGRGSLVMLGFPFETITSAANRAAVIDRVFDFFGLATPALNADFNGDGAVDAADYTIWRDSLGQTVTPGELGDANFDGQVDDADYTVWRDQFGTSPGAAAKSSGSLPTSGAAALAESMHPFVPFDEPADARSLTPAATTAHSSPQLTASGAPSLLLTKKFAPQRTASADARTNSSEPDATSTGEQPLANLPADLPTLE